MSAANKRCRVVLMKGVSGLQNDGLCGDGASFFSPLLFFQLVCIGVVIVIIIIATTTTVVICCKSIGKKGSGILMFGIFLPFFLVFFPNTVSALLSTQIVQQLGVNMVDILWICIHCRVILVVWHDDHCFDRGGVKCRESGTCGVVLIGIIFIGE